MKRYSICALILFAVLVTSACQEIKITVEFPNQESLPSETMNPPTSVVPTGTPTPTRTDQTNTPSPTASDTMLPTSTHTKTLEPAVGPASYLLDWQDLPQNVYFTGGHLKIFNLPYLFSPGNLAGVAYVREFFAYPEDIYFTEIIIHSPLQITPEMLRAGFYGDTIGLVEEGRQLGDFTLAGNREDDRFTQAYRFFQGNTMVVLALQGSHPYVTEENVYLLAKEIHNRLPVELPDVPAFPEMTGEVDEYLYEKYFRNIQLEDCTENHTPVDTFVDGDGGYCFGADTIEPVTNLKVGIYSPRYETLLYQKEFQTYTYLGEHSDGLFYPVWDFGWQHLQEGEYEARFWVDDQLAASIPFHFSQ